MTTVPDPVVGPIVRNRLLAITDQMRLALQSVSGSPTVTEASDFFTGLYLADGSFATMGYQVTFEAPPVGALIRHLLVSSPSPTQFCRLVSIRGIAYSTSYHWDRQLAAGRP